MAFELIVIGFAIATGYVAAGLVTSLYSLVTNRPASFQTPADSFGQKVLQVPVVVLGGPFILLRNALRGRAIENRPLGWVFMSLFIVMSWSFVSGLFVMHLALSI